MVTAGKPRTYDYIHVLLLDHHKPVEHAHVTLFKCFHPKFMYSYDFGSWAVLRWSGSCGECCAGLVGKGGNSCFFSRTLGKIVIFLYGGVRPSCKLLSVHQRMD